MSYIDETYGKQLEEALRGLVSRPALGQPWFGFHESEVPAGVLLFTATTHSRVLYADFWKYIQDRNLVKTEEEWQSIFSAQGWCPFYSDGDGIDTFRMPSAPLYLHGANTLSEAGKYIEAGLPNIKAAYANNGLGTQDAYSGAFYSSDVRERTYSQHTNVTSNVPLLSFDASRSNPIYGASDTVTPETSKMLFGVWAISAPQQPIPDATVEGIISELGVASNNALEASAKAETAISNLNSVVRSVNGVSADEAGSVKVGLYIDYTAGVTRSVDTTYTASEDGLLIVRSGASGNTQVNCKITINSVQVIIVNVYTNVGLHTPLPITKGDTYTVTGTSNIQIRFYPQK